MGFVFREFTSDELADIRRKIKGEVVQLYWKGAVDDARNIYFVDLGEITMARENENLSFFNLIWGDDTVAIQAKPHFEGVVGAFTFAFDITSITIPKTLNQEPETVRQAIEAAVDVYKHALRPGDYKVVATLPATIG
jgi:hypothetical protein